jgi:EasF-like predicted methyltransferase
MAAEVGLSVFKNLENLRRNDADPLSPKLSRSRETLDIIDIRDKNFNSNLASSIRSGLKNVGADGMLQLPSLLLWDEAGLKHFERVTYSPGYYLTQAEINLLSEHALQIAKGIEPESILLELGSGNLRKTSILLEALDSIGKQVDYYALDLNNNELVRTLRDLQPSRFKHVRCNGLLGTFNDGWSWISQASLAERSKCLLFLGSTLGSMTPSESNAFLKSWTTALQAENATHWNQSPGQMILGLDRCTSKPKVCGAYQDDAGVNNAFILNALHSANNHLGYRAFDAKDWTAEGFWDAENARHHYCLTPIKRVLFEGITLEAGQKISIVYSHKYHEAAMQELLSGNSLEEVARYLSGDEHYGKQNMTVD